MTLSPGTRRLLLVCLLALPLLFTTSAKQLEYTLYDFQLRLARDLQGDPLPSSQMVVVGLDEPSVSQGFSEDDLETIADQFPKFARLVSQQHLESYFEPDSDGTVRGITLVRTKPDGSFELAPPFSHYLAFRGLTADDVRLEEHQLHFGTESLLLDDNGRAYPLFPFVAASSASEVEARGTGELWKFFDPFGLVEGHRVGRQGFSPVSARDLPDIVQHLDGKLLILGSHLKIADDFERSTPTGHMVSLMLYASTTDALLSGRWLQPTSYVFTLLATILGTVFICWWLPGKSSFQSLASCLGLAVLWLTGNQILFLSGHFTQEAPLLILGFLALSAHLLFRVLRLTQALRGFGGDELLEKAEHELVATICFTNLPGTIKNMEQTHHEQGQAARAAYAQCLGQVVTRHGGRLIDQQGDAQMIAFGLDSEPNHSSSAIACALQIVADVASLLGEVEGKVHCGIVTGPVAVGKVGGGSYHSVAAIGDTTNAAARLMGKAQDRGLAVLASRQTTDTLGPRLERRDAGEISLRGREQPVLVDEVVAFDSPPQPLVTRPSTEFPRVSLYVMLAACLSSLFFGIVLNRVLPFQFSLLDHLTQSKAKAPVYLAGIDEESLQQHPWPWPRAAHAQVIENCREAGVQGLFFDLVFDQIGTDPEDDETFVRAVLANPFVVLAAVLPDKDKEPFLIGGLNTGEQWGLIHVATDATQRDQRVREALWRLGKWPGAPLALARLLAPHWLDRLSNEASFYIRWGPAPETISYHRLLDASDPIFQKLRGAVLVVGDNTAAPSDTFETPVGLRKGAFIHALTVQTLMTDGVIRDRSDSIWSVLLSLALVVVTMVAMLKTRGTGRDVLVFLGLGSAVVICIAAVANFGYYLGTLPLISLFSASLFGLALKALGVSRKLTNYVPLALQQRLDKEGTVADKTVWATVLVTDIRGYTTLSEGKSPVEILRLLNRYHEVTAACYARQGGHLLTYQGDAQIVVFGAIDPLSSPVESAIRAATELPDLLAHLNADAGIFGDEEWDVGAALATGQMTLSLMKAGGQLQYTVLGEPVRRAHGLQSLSQELDSKLLLDQASALAVSDLRRTVKKTSSQGATAYVLATNERWAVPDPS